MELEANLIWENDLVFRGELDGFSLTIDGNHGREKSPKGPKPKGLTLLSLAGCTAMDVIGIAKKMKQNLDSFSIQTRAKVADDHPKRILHIQLIYIFSGKDLNPEQIKKAVQLSSEKYCGVHATLAPAVPIVTEIVINDRPVP